jgi:hypothetical protein
MTDIKSQAEKDKSLTAAVIKRSDIFGESAGGAGLDDQKVKEVRMLSLIFLCYCLSVQYSVFEVHERLLVLCMRAYVCSVQHSTVQ